MCVHACVLSLLKLAVTRAALCDLKTRPSAQDINSTLIRYKKISMCCKYKIFLYSDKF